MLLETIFRPFKFRKYRLMTPGPVPLSPDVLKSLAQPMIHHRTPEFENCFKSALKKLKDTFQTAQDVFMLCSTGSGAMEAAIVNTLSPGDEILVIESGKFGERWASIANAYGLNVRSLEVPWGYAVELSQIENALIKFPHIKAVLCQACETSTATLHPIREIANLVKKRDATIFMVDAITGLGAMEILIDAWGIDVLVSGSQKAFMLPTGLSFISLSEKAWKFQKSAKLPRYYFDLAQEKTANEKGQSFFSSAVTHIRALDIALNSLTGKNLKNSIQRSKKLAESLRVAAMEMGLSVYSHSPSPSVTALSTPEGIDAGKLRTHIEKKYKITLMEGQDQLKGKILRIGHLGYITDEDQMLTIEAIGLALRDFGHNLQKEKIANAVNSAKAVLNQ